MLGLLEETDSPPKAKANVVLIPLLLHPRQTADPRVATPILRLPSFQLWVKQGKKCPEWLFPEILLQ